MVTPVSFPVWRLAFWLAAVGAAMSGGVSSLRGQPTLIGQSIPGLNVTVGASAQNVNLASYIKNPNATGTVVRIAVGTLNPNASTIAPSSIVPIGNIDIALTDNLTPNTVANFLAYINSGAFMDNIIHRSEPGFVIQGGGFNFSLVNNVPQTGAVPTMAPIAYEQGLPNVAGTIAMAQVGTDQNSATSQWFINLVDNSSYLDSLNGGFCAFGTVLGNGMTVANTVAALQTYNLSSYVSAWTNVPLANFNGNLSNLSVINFVFTNISKIPALTFNATSGNTSLFTVSVSGNTLTVSPAGAATGSTTITVTATDTEGATFQTTFSATINPATAPTFTTSPANTTVTAGSAASFTAVATSTATPTLQWQISTDNGLTWANLTDGNGVTGSTTGTLTISNTATTMLGNQFRAVATNSATSVASNPATLTVQSAVAASYTFLTLDIPAAVYGTTTAGIADGNVTGTFTDRSDLTQGFVYNLVTQAYLPLNAPGAYYGTFATGISDGNVIGYYYDVSDNVQGVRYSIADQTYTTLADPAALSFAGQGTFPRGIDGGNIAGYYFDGVQSYHGFLYNGTAYTTLDNPAGTNNWVTGISGGVMVGYYLAADYPHGFVYDGTAYTAFDDPAAAEGTFPQSISGANIVGFYVDGNGTTHGFVYNGSTFTTVDDPAAVDTYVVGISGNYLVGYYKDGNGATHGFLATLVVAGMPVITTQPTGVAVTPGQNVTLTAAASGTPSPVDQWQFSTDGGLTWSNLTDGGGVTGSATGTLKITNASSNISGENFRLYATNSIGWAASNAATVTVTPPPSAPVITTQPGNQAVTISQTATIAMSATGSPTPAFQWQREAAGSSTFVNLSDGSTYAGVTTATLFVINATLDMSGDKFQCIVTNASATVTSKVVTLTVTKAPAMVVLSNTTQTYNGLARTVGVATNPPNLVVDLTYNGTTIPPSNVGSYAVVATVEDASYTGTANATLVITKASQTINFGPLGTSLVGDAPVALTAVASSRLPVTYTTSNAAVATVTNGILTIVGKGTATITATQPGNANFQAAAKVSQTLTVYQTPTFTTEPTNQTVTAGQKATYKVVVVGTTPITYLWQREAAGTSTFVNLANGGSYSGVTTATFSVSGTTLAMSGDQFQCVAMNSAGSTTSNPVILTVNKVLATVKLSNLAQTYTGTPRPVMVTTSPAGLAVNVTYDGSTTAPTVPGSYAVVATVTDPNHSGSASGTLVIKPAAATVILSSLSQAYDGNPKSVTVTTNPVGLSFTVTYNGSATPPVNGGSYAVVATITDPFSSGTKTGTLVITKAAQTITFGPLAAAKVGDAPLTLTATASSGLPVTYTSSNSKVATVSGNTVTFVGLGKATITASQAGDADYNAAKSVAQTLNVSQPPVFTTQPAGQTVAAGVKASFKVAAGGTAPITYQWQREAAGTSTFINLTNGGNYAGVTTTTLSVSGTTVAMTGDQFQCVATNSVGTATSNSATLTVNKAPATVTLSNLTQTYTGTSLAVKVATTPAGLAYNVTYDGSMTAPTVPGNYAVVATVTDANHTGSKSGTLVVKPATATVTLSGLSQPYDGNPQSVTVTTKPVGLSFTVTYNGSTDSPVSAGSYPIVATVTDGNYTGTGKGTLVIAKASQTITFGALGTQVVGNSPLALTATASSGLLVTYKSSNAAVASISGSTVTVVGKGSATITASQAGNANYNAAPAKTQTLTVTAAPISPALASPSKAPASDSPALASPSGSTSGTSSSNVTIVTDNISSSLVDNGDSSAWVSDQDPASAEISPNPTAADLPALLLQAMNLDITSPDDLLPLAAIETVDNVSYLTLQYRQSKDPTAPVLVAQYSTDGITWFDVPAGDLTQLPDDDDNTARWSAQVDVPDVGPVYLRVEAGGSP